MEKYKKIYNDYFTDDLPRTARYIFLPHAGYQYSGFASWCALAKVQWSKIKRVILLTTSHFIPYSMNGIRITDERYPNIIIDGYSSPGLILPTMTPEQFVKEHSWQYLLPLFQFFCKPRSKLHIQIICVRDSLPESVVKIIRTDIESQKNKNTILVGNSDLSHLNGHFTDKARWMKDIMNQDYKTLNSLLSQSSPESASSSACGIGVIRVFLDIITVQTVHGLTPRLMCYYNCCQTKLLQYLSQSISPDSLESALFADPGQELDMSQGCVGYGSIVYYENNSQIYPGNFSAYEQYYMTHLSQNYLLHHQLKQAYILPIPELISNQYNMGIFVTLTNKTTDELMGCIGTLQPIKGTLLDAIYYYTDQAAYHDSRFSKPPEISNMEVEITLLFLNRIFRYVKSMEAYPNHGLKLVSSMSGNQAFFLPSVREMLVERSIIRPINHREINEELVRMLRHKGNIFENEPIQLYLIPTKRLYGL